MIKDAILSKDRRFRYALLRHWDERNKRVALFIGLNPSTADESNDDPTIRRCISFARSWGMGGLVMCNLFAYRATDPAVMRDFYKRMTYADFVGQVDAENRATLLRQRDRASTIIAAWGRGGTFMDQDIAVSSLLRGPRNSLYCLGTTKDGHPRHPLYLRKDAQRVHYICRSMK